MNANPATRLLKYPITNNNPFELFSEWHSKISKTLPFIAANAMSIATISENGAVSNRTVHLQEVKDEHFIFNTTTRSQKSKDIAKNTQVALVFLWICPDEVGGTSIVRQVRVEGNAELLPISFAKAAFDTSQSKYTLLNTFCKQGEVIKSWDDYARRHSDFANELKTKKPEYSDYFVYYKVKPYRMEFYYGVDDEITFPDRILFTINDKNAWMYERIEP